MEMKRRRQAGASRPHAPLAPRGASSLPSYCCFNPLSLLHIPRHLESSPSFCPLSVSPLHFFQVSCPIVVFVSVILKIDDLLSSCYVTRPSPISTTITFTFDSTHVTLDLLSPSSDR